MSKYFFLTLTYLIANPLDDWVDQNKNIIKEKIKSVSFKIRLESGIDSKEFKILNGQIVIGGNKQFRFEMGPRTVVSDGTLWKSYDERTDQIFFQKPDKKFEKILFSWSTVKKLKSLKKIIDRRSRGSNLRAPMDFFTLEQRKITARTIPSKRTHPELLILSEQKSVDGFFNDPSLTTILK